MEQRNHPQTMGTTKEKDGMSKRRKTQNNLVDNLLKYLTEFISLWKYAMPCRKTVKIKNSSSKSEITSGWTGLINKTCVCVFGWPEVILQDVLKAVQQVWFISVGQRSEEVLLPYSVASVNFNLGEATGCQTESLQLLFPAACDLYFQW